MFISDMGDSDTVGEGDISQEGAVEPDDMQLQANESDESLWSQITIAKKNLPFEKKKNQNEIMETMRKQVSQLSFCSNGTNLRKPEVRSAYTSLVSKCDCPSHLDLNLTLWEPDQIHLICLLAAGSKRLPIAQIC